MYFNEDEMVKAVADVDKGILELNAELHSDLEQMLLENGSDQKSFYGFNIYFDGEIEYDFMINPPRNREAGFPRVGRDVADPVSGSNVIGCKLRFYLSLQLFLFFLNWHNNVR